MESHWGIDFYYKSNDVLQLLEICRTFANIVKNSGLSANWQCWQDSNGVW